MARSRLLKPGFFKNEDLAQLPPHARLCFAGLWLLADREGRLEDRPLRLKAEIFPYETLDMDALLASLDSGGFIRRYHADSSSFIAICKFASHQTPHIREAVSTIPAPGLNGSSTVLASVEASPRSPVSVSVSVSDPVPISKSVPKSVEEPPYPPKGGRLTRDERKRAEHIRTKSWGHCRHYPKCTKYEDCVTRIGFDNRTAAMRTA